MPYLASSFNYLSKNATFTMDRNNATEYGGAVYVQDSEPISYCFPNVSPDCFIQISGIPRLNPTNISYALPNLSLHMLNNSAQIAGSSIYGGSLDSCTINVEYTTSTVQQSLSILSLNWTYTWSQTAFLLIHFKCACVKTKSQTATLQNWLDKCTQGNCSIFL